MKKNRRGFTLVELLVVIAIIGVLVALLLPAVQAARESARRTQCTNHLKQLALAGQNHAGVHGHFPTGGWGWGWVGDPDQGYGRDQPGGWIYNSLPFVEQQTLHDIGSGLSFAEKRVANKQMVSTPLSSMLCPSRRAVEPYPNVINSTFVAWNCEDVEFTARSDYASLSSSTNGVPHVKGPPSIEEGEAPQDYTYDLDGIVFERSEVRIAEITDGTSQTFYIGEKYLNPDQYLDGSGAGDNECMYTGNDDDLGRSASRFSMPIPDRAGLSNSRVFGSAHSGGLLFGFCDGSVHFITYEIDIRPYRNLGNRRDGRVVDMSDL